MTSRDIRRRLDRLLPCLLAAALAISCGGGTQVAGGVGTEGTGNAPPSIVGTGSIEGFGSVIVNGIAFDDSRATVFDDDGATLSAGALKLGQVVRIAGTQSDAVTGSASSIRLQAALRGPVGIVDAAARSFTVLGTAVIVNDSTVLDGKLSLQTLQPGDRVEVYGQLNPGGALVAATRIERSSAADVRLTGVITALDTSARRFAIGPYTIDYAAAQIDADAAAALGNGALLRVVGAAPDAQLLIRATQLQAGTLAVGNAQRAAIEGVVTDYASLASFRLGGIAVDASAASISGGNAGDIAAGVRVAAVGRVAQGALVAEQLRILRNDVAQEYRVRGVITRFTSPSDFVVRDVVIDASSPGVSFSPSNYGVGNLALGVAVDVRGTIANTAGGPVLRATQVQFR
jgi:hypothetical protein